LRCSVDEEIDVHLRDCLLAELNAVLMRCYVWERGNTITAAAVQKAILQWGSPISSQTPLQNLDDAISQLGKETIDRALAATGGKKAAAARLLGLNSPQTMNNRYGMYQQRLARGKAAKKGIVNWSLAPVSAAAIIPWIPMRNIVLFPRPERLVETCHSLTASSKVRLAIPERFT
jgi:hypothetical protein